MNTITAAAKEALLALLEKAKLSAEDLFLVGCSTSEIAGETIGTAGSLSVAKALWDGIYPVLSEKGIFLAVQCCEHLNRAVVLEEKAAKLHRLAPVNAVPHPKAGGAFAAHTYASLEKPTVVEGVLAAAGMDIGNVLIGMNLAPVAVPVRVSVKKIGQAQLVCARTRPKFVGGVRAQYDDNLL